MKLQNIDNWLSMPIFSDDQNGSFHILRVPGGWIVTNTTYKTSVFVPEPKHQPDQFWIKAQELAELRNQPINHKNERHKLIHTKDGPVWKEITDQHETPLP